MVRLRFYAIRLFALPLSALLTLLLPSFSMAAPQLLFVYDKTEIQLGHYINAELYGIDLKSKLADIDLRNLNENFGVTIEETSGGMEDDRWPNQSVQMSQLKLYPRTTGNLTVPALSIDNAHNKQQTILVVPGIKKSRTGTTNISQKINISSIQPWERQQVIIEVEVTAADTFSSLRSEKLNVPGFEIFPIPPSAEKVIRNEISHSVMRIGWVLLPLSSGAYNIEIPPIQYRRSGQTKRTYYFPKQNINVKTLPPYIPPTMPVGKINITTRLKSDTLFYPGILRYWDITLTGNGVSPGWIPPVLRQIKSNSDIQILPVHTERTPKVTRDGLQGQVIHNIPFKPVSSGRLSLPSLRIQYFDPASAKIITITHPAQFSLVLNLGLRIVIGIFISLLLFWLGKYIYGKICFFRQRRQRRQTAVSAIEEASTFLELRMALNLLANAESWPANMALHQYVLHEFNNFKAGDHFHELLGQLSRACYGKKANADFKKLRSAFLLQLRPA